MLAGSVGYISPHRLSGSTVDPALRHHEITGAHLAKVATSQNDLTDSWATNKTPAVYRSTARFQR